MDSLYLGYLEDKHCKKIRKRDKPVVFTGRKGAIWGIVLTLVLAAVIAWCFTAPFDPEGAWLRWPLGILFFLGELWFLFFSYANLNARVILTKESISITGPVRDFEEGVFADSKLALKQLFRVNRQVEMKWSEIEKIQRPGSRMGLYFYTKSGQRYLLSAFFFDTRFMPTLKRYMKYQTVYNWWL